MDQEILGAGNAARLPAPGWRDCRVAHGKVLNELCFYYPFDQIVKIFDDVIILCCPHE
jgi:hypothetical protein